jgi:hypothetical protein
VAKIWYWCNSNVNQRKSWKQNANKQCEDCKHSQNNGEDQLTILQQKCRWFLPTPPFSRSETANETGVTCTVSTWCDKACESRTLFNVVNCVELVSSTAVVVGSEISKIQWLRTNCSPSESCLHVPTKLTPLRSRDTFNYPKPTFRDNCGSTKQTMMPFRWLSPKMMTIQNCFSQLVNTYPDFQDGGIVFEMLSASGSYRQFICYPKWQKWGTEWRRTATWRWRNSLTT